MQKFKVLSSKKQRKSDKSVRVLFPRDIYEMMRAAFIASEASSREGYAVAQCGLMADGSRKNWTYIVRSLHVPAAGDIVEQSSITVTPRAEFMEAVLSDAALKNNVIVEIHTHVGSSEPNFSWVDIENGLENGRFLKACGMRFAMAVVGSEGFSICEYDSDHDALQTPGNARVSIIGRGGVKDVIFHRSGSSCQIPQIENMRVSIVGMGGVGFGIAGTLAGIGVRKFILYDEGIVDDSVPDVLPFTAEKGKKRTKAALNMLKKISGDMEVTQVSDARSLKAALKDADVIFKCGSDEDIKILLNEVSLKYFIPCIEARTFTKSMGSGPYGLVRVYMPSATGCIGCFADEPDGPACGADASTIAVNSVVSSMAVQEFLDLVSGRGQGNKAYDHIEYDPSTQLAERKSSGRREACPMCGKDGILGAGDERKQTAKAPRIRKAKKE